MIKKQSSHSFVPRSAHVNLMAQAAFKASKKILRDFGEIEHLQVSQKGLGDFVTSADKFAEKIIITHLKEKQPTYGILSEEIGDHPGSNPDYRWVIDPIDGTTNYMQGIPNFAISIALQFRGEVIAGITYDPIQDELFWAEKGQGAYLNQKRLRISQKRDMDRAILSMEPPYPSSDKIGRFYDDMKHYSSKVMGIRYTGSNALNMAYVAANRYDVFMAPDISAWDMAAGILLIREAGGQVTEIDGRKKMMKFGNVLAANFNLHPQFIRK